MGALDETDTLMRVIFIGLLLAWVGSGVIRRYRGMAGTAVRDFMLWGLIVFGLIVAYGFKDQFMAQIRPGAPVESGDAVRLARAADGHFHALILVNGVEVDFVVDTGASSIVLSRRDAERVGFDPAHLVYSGRAQTANGTTRTAQVRLKTMALGKIFDDNLRATVNEGALFSSLLGLDYLDRFRSYTVQGDTMVLRR